MEDENQKDARGPAVWVRRFVLLEGLQPLLMLPDRDIRLHRGLNVVWGVDSEDGEIHLLAGHSVGKTLFCRLIRYGLGDDTYERESFLREVERHIPGAYVGLEVVIDGEVWSVLRPLTRKEPGAQGRGKTRSRLDHAGKGITIEELASCDDNLNFEEYRRVLDGVARRALRLSSTEGFKFPWRVLLQWCARDQETRFQEVTLWRSRRSGAGVPVDPAFADLAMRSALGLVESREAEQVLRVAECERRLHDAKSRNERARNAMWAVVRQLSSRYVSLEPRSIDEAVDPSVLIGPENAIEGKLAEAQARLSHAERALEATARECYARHAAWDQNERECKAYQAQIDSGAETDYALGQELRDIKWLKDQVGTRTDERCALGDVLLDHCTHVTHRLSQAAEIVAENATRRKAVENERAQAQKERTEYLRVLKERSEELRSAWDEAERVQTERRQSVQELRDAIRAYRSDLADIRRYVQALTSLKTHQFPSDSPVSVEDLSGMEAELESSRQELDTMRRSRIGQITRVSNKFDQVVKGVLTDAFSGRVLETGGQLDFILDTGRGQGGEAVDTLCVILADLCALSLTVDHAADLPGMLVHDSPREADLQRDVYHRVFRYTWELEAQHGGTNNAPFQYIITTTTAPPENAKDSEHVILKLSAKSDEHLLLRCRISPSSGAKTSSERMNAGSDLFENGGADEQ